MRRKQQAGRVELVDYLRMFHHVLTNEIPIIIKKLATKYASKSGATRIAMPNARDRRPAERREDESMYQE